MKIENAEIKTMELAKLKPAKYNPRIELQPDDDTYKRIKASITKFGLVDPLVVNKRNGLNIIVGGHQRYNILKDLGYKEVQCVLVDLDEVDEIELNLSLNKNVGFWDNDKLKDIFVNIDFDEEQKYVTGFSEEEIEDLLKQNEEVQEDNFDVEEILNEVKENPICKLGDIWKLGQHRLMCGDSTNKNDIEKLVNGEMIKCLFTSPPYNMGANLYENYTDNLESQKYIDFNLKVVKNWIEFIKGYLFWNISYNKNTRWEFIEILYRMIKETKLRYMELIVWDKGHGMPIVSKDMLTRQYEDILMLGDDESISNEMELYYLGTTEKRGYFNKTRGKGITNYWKIGTGNTQLENHKACFPVELPARAIKLTTQKNDIVADCFGGSGTTLIAAEQLDRRCFMMELDPEYCDVIIKRWESYTGKKAERIK